MFYWFPSGSQSPINSNIASLSLIPILELNPHWRLIHRTCPISSQLPLHGTSLYTIVAIKMSKSSFLNAKQNTVTDLVITLKSVLPTVWLWQKIIIIHCLTLGNITSSSPPLASSWSWPSMRQSRLSCKYLLKNLREKTSFRVLSSLSIIYEHSHGFPFDFCSWFLLFLFRSMRQSRLSWEYETSAWWAKQGRRRLRHKGWGAGEVEWQGVNLDLHLVAYYRWYEYQTNFWICLSKYRYWITWITLWSINANLFLEKAACTELIHSPGISNGPPLTKACILGSTL